MTNDDEIDDPKRKFRRKPVHVEVKIRDELGSGEVLFDTADMSLGGAFLKSDLLLELGEELELEISGTPPVKARARVVRAVRTHSHRSGPGMGIEFISPSDAFKCALVRVIEEPRETLTR
jgi:PilZ domain